MRSIHAKDAQKMLPGPGPEGRGTPGCDLGEDSDLCAFCGQCTGVLMHSRHLRSVADEGWSGRSRGLSGSSHRRHLHLLNRITL